MKIFVITGQTATGKTQLALDLAQKNTNKSDKSVFSAIANWFKGKLGKYSYVFTADYGTTQVREKGTLIIEAKKNLVPLP